MNEHVPPSKFRRYRDRKRAAGLREVRAWVPDLDSPKWQAMLDRERVSAAREVHRDTLRREPVRLPDTLAPGFAEEARRQARLLAAAPDDDEVMDFIEAIVDAESWQA